jgi:RNA polymerase sigma factor (sigma-70 family)
MPQAQSAQFHTTRWSIVLAAAGPDEQYSRKALKELCRIYWQPLFAYLRRKGYDHHDAQDLTQSFLASLLKNQTIPRADQEKGRFRSFLLVALQRFIINEWHKDHAQKRSGHIQFSSIDAENFERTYAELPANLSPETVYELDWAYATVQNALAKVRAQAESRGRGKLFDSLNVYLTGESVDTSQERTAEELKLPVATVRTMVHRLRKEYREALRREIADTVATSDDIDDELRYLRQVLVTASHVEKARP